MLRKWKQKRARAATYNRLCQAFRKCGLIDLEEKVMQLVTGSYTCTTDNTSSVSTQATVNLPSTAVPIGIHFVSAYNNRSA